LTLGLPIFKYFPGFLQNQEYPKIEFWEFLISYVKNTKIWLKGQGIFEEK